MQFLRILRSLPYGGGGGGLGRLGWGAATACGGCCTSARCPKVGVGPGVLELPCSGGLLVYCLQVLRILTSLPCRGCCGPGVHAQAPHKACAQSLTPPTPPPPFSTRRQLHLLPREADRGPHWPAARKAHPGHQQARRPLLQVGRGMGPEVWGGRAGAGGTGRLPSPSLCPSVDPRFLNLFVCHPE